MTTVTLHLGDCLEIMPTLPQVDAIITDLPYGTTACKWDSIIPFEPMWREVKRILKPRGVFVTTASQPFTSKLVMSNPEWFKYSWVWDKRKGGNIFLSNYQPMKTHEDIVVFSSGASVYHPQMEVRDKVKKSKNYGTGAAFGGNGMAEDKVYTYTHTFPKSIIDVSNAYQIGKVHPTQKPVALYEYLIRTYTNEGDTVLDFCAGSGTTGVACVNTGRNAILIEKERTYFEIIQRRIAEAQAQPNLFEAQP